MPQTNPRWLIVKAPSDLKTQIRFCVEHGYQVISQTSSTAQLMRKKQFSCLFATLSFFLFGIGFFIYLFYYLSKKDDLIYLDIDTQPSKAEIQKQLEEEKRNADIRNKRILKASLIFFGILILLSIIGSFAGNK